VYDSAPKENGYPCIPFRRPSTAARPSNANNSVAVTPGIATRTTLKALEIGVPERFRAATDSLKIHSLAKYYASARSQICFSDPKFRYRSRPKENCLLRMNYSRVGRSDFIASRTPAFIRPNHPSPAAYLPQKGSVISQKGHRTIPPFGCAATRSWSTLTCVQRLHCGLHEVLLRI
jgi:hypothetical protein